MRSTTALKVSSIQQLLSLTLGYPALLIYFGIALAETLKHSPWVWTASLLALYLIVLARVVSKPLSNG